MTAKEIQFHFPELNEAQVKKLLRMIHNDG
jgi:hypothetical protein